jgi:hypothetical protein
MNYKYQLAGYIFETNIYLPELTVATGKAGCSLMLRPEVSTKIPLQALTITEFYDEGLKLICLQKKSAGLICIWDNTQLEYVPHAHLTAAEIRGIVLNTIAIIMSTCMGYTALHAACVVINGRAILFSGKSGSGKSSLAAWFYIKGYKVLSDDVIYARQSAEGNIMIYPSVPRIKLSTQALNFLGQTEDSLEMVEGPKLKYSLPLLGGNADTPYKLGAIILPAFAGGLPSLKSITGMLKIEVVAKNLHRRKIARHLNQAVQTNALIFSICNATPIYSYLRPDNLDDVDEGFAFIAQKLDELVNPV